MPGDGGRVRAVKRGVGPQIAPVDVELRAEIVGKPLLVAEVGVVGRRIL